MNQQNSQFGDVPVHTSESLAKRNEPTGTIDTVKTLLGKRQKQIKALLAGQLDPVKFATVAMTTIRNNEKLLECTPESLLMAIIMAAQRGLSLDPTLGQAYLVPYWNSKLKRREAQYQTGYQGKIHLAKRDGDVVVDSFVIYENDTFKHTRNSAGDDFVHEPTPLTEDPGEAVGWVARARLPDGRTLFEVMRKADVEKIRQSVKQRYGKDTPAWSQWFDEQGRGKAVNRLAKYLPQSPALQLDAAQESAMEGGQAQIIAAEADDGTMHPVVVPQQLEEGEPDADGVVETPRQSEGTPVETTAQSAPELVTEPPPASGSDAPPTTPNSEDGDHAASQGVTSARAAFGLQIAALRKKIGLTQAALAGQTGIKQNEISAFETGKKIPNAATAALLITAVQGDPAVLLPMAGHEAPAPVQAEVPGEGNPPGMTEEEIEEQRQAQRIAGKVGETGEIPF